MDQTTLNSEFRSKESLYKKLEQEGIFILENSLQTANVTVHLILSRIKKWDSFLAKAQRKQLDDPLNQIHDVVGLRVICLFLSDIEVIGNLIRKSFSVLKEDNKIEGADVSSFGYMSVHFIVEMKKEHKGPRYDSIASMPLEIQVRTIAMDAWANLSHHLSYKTNKDVPTELRKDFYALSGLFYVADKHFEMFYNVSKQSEREMLDLFATSDSAEKAEQEVNVDSLRAYLIQRLPERQHTDASRLSELVTELFEAGYKSIGEVDRMLNSTSRAFEEYEKEYPPLTTEKKFADMGVVRASANIASDDYLKVYVKNNYPRKDYDKEFKNERRRYGKFRYLLGNEIG